MGTDKRQKYNFLVALTRQLKEARDDDGDEYADFQVELSRIAAEPGEFNEWATRLEDRVGKCEQWLAALETALDSLEQVVSACDDEDAEEPDDGDYIEDVGAMEPEVGGVERAPSGGALGMGGAVGQSRVVRRDLAPVPQKRRVGGGNRGPE